MARVERTCFPGRDVLPESELSTIAAVQSITGTQVEFPSWFAALDHMRK